MPNTSVYISADFLKQLDARRIPSDGNVGSQIRVLAERALGVLEAEKRALTFTEQEWLTLLDCFNGLQCDFDLVRHIATEIEDYIELAPAHRAHGLSDEDADALIERIDALSISAKWALLDVAEQFWARGIEASAAGLKQLGVVCRE